MFPTCKNCAIGVVALGAAMVNNLATTVQVVETLHWDHVVALGGALIG